MSCYMYLITLHVAPLSYTHVESILLSFMLILWNFRFKKCTICYVQKVICYCLILHI